MTADEEELEGAIARILQSTNSRRLVVAGPGTGKTTLFRRLLDNGGARHRRLVMTFINNLKADLEDTLGSLAEVHTLHGYCHYLLRRYGALRDQLSEEFHYYPPISSLVKRDWELAKGGRAPAFVQLMRTLDDVDTVNFYTTRATFYDAVGYDDSIYRVHEVLQRSRDVGEAYDLLLVDEFQDFNKLEASFIDALTIKSPAVVVGDDDQALYAHLRGASYEHIRALHRGGEYECFELPFCMRCPKAIIDAINALVAVARQRRLLAGRIDKPFKFFELRKGEDSRQYPRIKMVRTSVQSQQANYFGRYVEAELSRIPRPEVEESWTGKFPTVLIIGPQPYRGQVGDYLRAKGYVLDEREPTDNGIDRVDGLRMLQRDPKSNLGWRIVLECDRPRGLRAVIRRSVDEGLSLVALVPEECREGVLKEAASVAPEAEPVAKTSTHEDRSVPKIKVTSFEGSKGLSAQHVFIVGLHNGDLPRNPAVIEDLEMCRFIVALTRTRKLCHILYTDRFAGRPKQPSVFCGWIPGDVLERVAVNKEYWQKKSGRE